MIVPGAGGACNDPRTPSPEDGAENQRELESMRFTIGHNQPRHGGGKIIAARPGCENERDRSRMRLVLWTRHRDPLAAKPESPPPVLLPLEVVGTLNPGKKQNLGVDQARPADAAPGAQNAIPPLAPAAGPTHEADLLADRAGRRTNTMCRPGLRPSIIDVIPSLCSRTMRTKGCERPHIEV